MIDNYPNSKSVESYQNNMLDLIKGVEIAVVLHKEHDDFNVEYSDEKWFSRDYWWEKAPRQDDNGDIWFLHFLTWGPWKEERNNDLWMNVRNSYEKVNKRLHMLSAKELNAILESFQPETHNFIKGIRNILENMHDYLLDSARPIEKLEDELKSLGYYKARNRLLEITEPSGTPKVLDCYIRDRLKLPSFPIDRWVSDVLEDYGLPKNSIKLSRIAIELGMDPRILARAVYDLGEQIPARKNLMKESVKRILEAIE